ncbi:Esc1p RNJ42_03377 [Nakaseomyces bracarensis]|uniref:Esc1p n=1 Tax=Nakaseomyces bracarensis TaxID=273131 RepID=UPI0038711845
MTGSNEERLKLGVPRRGLKIRSVVNKKNTTSSSSRVGYRGNGLLKGYRLKKRSSAGSDMPSSPPQQTGKTLSYVQSLIQRGKDILEDVSHEDKQFETELKSITRREKLMDKVVTEILETDYGMESKKPENHVSFNPSESVIPSQVDAGEEYNNSIDHENLKEEEDVNEQDDIDGRDLFGGADASDGDGHSQYDDDEEIEEEGDYEEDHVDEEYETISKQIDDAVIILSDESENEHKEEEEEAEEEQDGEEEEEEDGDDAEEEIAVKEISSSEIEHLDDNYSDLEQDGTDEYKQDMYDEPEVDSDVGEDNNIDPMSYNVNEHTNQVYDDKFESYGYNEQSQDDSSEQEKLRSSYEIQEGHTENDNSDQENDHRVNESDDYENINTIDFSKYMKPRNFQMEVEEPGSDEFSDIGDENDFSHIVEENIHSARTMKPNPSFNVTEGHNVPEEIEILSSEVEDDQTDNSDDNLSEEYHNDHDLLEYQTNIENTDGQHRNAGTVENYNYKEINEKENELKDFLHHIDDFKSIANEALNSIADTNFDDSNSEQPHTEDIEANYNTSSVVGDNDKVEDFSEVKNSDNILETSESLPDNEKSQENIETIDKGSLLSDNYLDDQKLLNQNNNKESVVEGISNETIGIETTGNETVNNETINNETVGNETVYFSTLEGSPSIGSETDGEDSNGNITTESNQETKYELIITDLMYSSSGEEDSSKESEPYSSVFSFDPFKSQEMIKDVDFSEVLNKNTSKDRESKSEARTDLEKNVHNKTQNGTADHNISVGIASTSPDNVDIRDTKVSVIEVVDTNKNSESDKNILKTTVKTTEQGRDLNESDSSNRVNFHTEIIGTNKSSAVDITESTKSLSPDMDVLNNIANKNEEADSSYYDVQVPAPEAIEFNEIEDEGTLSNMAQSDVEILTNVIESAQTKPNAEGYHNIKANLDELDIATPPLTDPAFSAKKDVPIETSQLNSVKNQKLEQKHDIGNRTFRINNIDVDKDSSSNQKTSNELDIYVKEVMQRIDEKNRSSSSIQMDSIRGLPRSSNSTFNDIYAKLDDSGNEKSSRASSDRQSETEGLETSEEIESTNAMPEKKQVFFDEIDNNVNSVHVTNNQDAQLISHKLVIEQFDDDPTLFSKYSRHSRAPLEKISLRASEIETSHDNSEQDSKVESLLTEDNENSNKRNIDEVNDLDNSDIRYHKLKRRKTSVLRTGFRNLYKAAKNFFSSMDLDELIDYESETVKHGDNDNSSISCPDSGVEKEDLLNELHQNPEDEIIWVSAEPSLSNKSTPSVKSGIDPENKERSEILQQLKYLQRLSEGLHLPTDSTNIDDTQIVDIDDDIDLIESDNSIELDLNTRIIDQDLSSDGIDQMNQIPNSLSNNNKEEVKAQETDNKDNIINVTKVTEDSSLHDIERDGSKMVFGEEHGPTNMDSSFVHSVSTPALGDEIFVRSSTPELNADKSTEEGFNNQVERDSIYYSPNHQIDIRTADPKSTKSDDEIESYHLDNDNKSERIHESSETADNINETFTTAIQSHINADVSNINYDDANKSQGIKTPEHNSEETDVVLNSAIEPKIESGYDVITQSSNEPIAVRVHNEIESEKSTPVKVIDRELTPQEVRFIAKVDIKEVDTQPEEKLADKAEEDTKDISGKELPSKKDKKSSKKRKRAAKTKKTVPITNSPKGMRTRKSKKGKKESDTSEKNGSTKKTLRSTRRMHTRSQKKD